MHTCTHVCTCTAYIHTQYKIHPCGSFTAFSWRKIVFSNFVNEVEFIISPFAFLSVLSTLLPSLELMSMNLIFFLKSDSQLSETNEINILLFSGEMSFVTHVVLGLPLLSSFMLQSIKAWLLTPQWTSSYEISSDNSS